jgi:hypothetical protein
MVPLIVERRQPLQEGPRVRDFFPDIVLNGSEVFVLNHNEAGVVHRTQGFHDVGNTGDAGPRTLCAMTVVPRTAASASRTIKREVVMQGLQRCVSVRMD